VNGNDGRDDCVKVEASRGFVLPQKDPKAAEELNDLLLLVRPFFAYMIGQEMDYDHLTRSTGMHLSGTTQLGAESTLPL